MAVDSIIWAFLTSIFQLGSVNKRSQQNIRGHENRKINIYYFCLHLFPPSTQAEGFWPWLLSPAESHGTCQAASHTLMPIYLS